MSSTARPVAKEQPLPLFAYAFRPFFLLGAVYAALAVLLWVLHAGYAFLVLALVNRSLFLYGIVDTPSLWYHALGAGAMGVLIVGVMTRVTAGHTGRPLVLFRGGLAIYLCVLAAVALRLATAAGWLGIKAGLALSSLAWAGGFLLFAVLYGPALCRPRPDGRPG